MTCCSSAGPRRASARMPHTLRRPTTRSFGHLIATSRPDAARTPRPWRRRRSRRPRTRGRHPARRGRGRVLVGSAFTRSRHRCPAAGPPRRTVRRLAAKTSSGPCGRGRSPARRPRRPCRARLPRPPGGRRRRWSRTSSRSTRRRERRARPGARPGPQAPRRCRRGCRPARTDVTRSRPHLAQRVLDLLPLDRQFLAVGWRARSTTCAGALPTNDSFDSFWSMLPICFTVSARCFCSFSISAPRSACGIWMCTRRSPTTRVTRSGASVGCRGVSTGHQVECRQAGQRHARSPPARRGCAAAPRSRLRGWP